MSCDKKGYQDIGFAKIDTDRKARNGYPEVIFGLGKSPEHASKIFVEIAKREGVAVCTKASKEIASAIIALVPEAIYYESSTLVIYQKEQPEKVGCVVVAAAGTADYGIAEEASLILEVFGSNVERLYDVGVAGIHRLLDNKSVLDEANAIIAVAGMEGALASVIGGVSSVPVIGVPTSVGYGANFGGVSALLSMINSCAAGVSVVNINNGFGAAYQADMINKLTIYGKPNQK